MVIVFCSIFTVISLQWIASMLGARQAEEYQFVGGEVSGFGFLFWGMILIIFCLQTFLREYAFEMGTIVYYLGTYFFLEVTARIFERKYVIAGIACGVEIDWMETYILFCVVANFYILFLFFKNRISVVRLGIEYVSPVIYSSAKMWEVKLAKWQTVQNRWIGVFSP